MNSGLTLLHQTANALAVCGSDLFVGLNYYGIYRSANNGDNWTLVDSGLPTQININAFGVFEGYIFASITDTSGNTVYRSVDNGNSWKRSDSGLPNLPICAFSIIGSNLFAGTIGEGVFLSTNYGASWNAVNSGFKEHYSVSTLMASGTNLYAGTSGSVYLSTNNGTSWTIVNSGLPDTTFIYALSVSGNSLYAGTDFGAWRRPLSEILPIIQPKIASLNSLSDKIHISKALNAVVTFWFSLPCADQVKVAIYDLSGNKIATLDSKYFEKGSHNLTWDTSNIATGCYTVRIQVGSNSFQRSIPIFR